MTRREFGARAAAAGIAARTGGQARAASTIDQNPIRRRGVGLRGIDPGRVSAGLTLFVPMRVDRTVYLMDLHGKTVHEWHMPYPPGLYGYLTAKGTLFYNGQIPNETFIGKAPFRGGAILEANWSGKILWELRHPNHHHDGRLLMNGNVLLMCAKELPSDFIPKVRGGRPGTEVNGTIWADYVVEMTIKGETLWEWPVWEHLDPAEFPITAPHNDRSEWTHGNAVSELPDGSLLVSFRHISTIVKIDRKSGQIVWKLGSPTISGQHAPALLKSGNILIFDNGPYRVDQMFPFSRVIEVNPANNEIVRMFQEASPPNFFSDRISNAQRLPNGNTLVNEEMFGRFFEVTAEGEVVWEYVNPYFGQQSVSAGAQQNSVFRVYRYSEEEIATARTA